MSSFEPTRSPALGQLTKQQLDELEVLMQRMLALPASPADEEAPLPVHLSTADHEPLVPVMEQAAVPQPAVEPAAIVADVADRIPPADFPLAPTPPTEPDPAPAVKVRVAAMEPEPRPEEPSPVRDEIGASRENPAAAPPPRPGPELQIHRPAESDGGTGPILLRAVIPTAEEPGPRVPPRTAPGSSPARAWPRQAGAALHGPETVAAVPATITPVETILPLESEPVDNDEESSLVFRTDFVQLRPVRRRRGRTLRSWTWLASPVGAPLVWCNQAFDGLAGCLGAPGRWLREPRGRGFLGGAGLLLLLMTLLWGVMDWIGWTW